MSVSELEMRELYLPVRAFVVIEGNETAERFNDMHRLLNKNRAAQFWGVEEEWAKIHGTFFNAVIPRPNTIDSRLVTIKYALRTVPNPDEFTASVAHDITTKEIVIGSRRTAAKRIIDTSSKKKTAKLPLTYGEAHDTPEIRNSAVVALRELGDPATELVRSLEGWRQANNSVHIPDSLLRQGHSTFDALLLSSEESPYAVELGKAAVRHLRVMHS